MWPFHSQRHHPRLGIDIGTSAVKVVVLSPGDKPDFFKLENYGMVMSYAGISEPAGAEAAARRLTDEEIVAMTKAVLAEMKLGKHQREAVLSIPVYASFITEVSLPRMPITELAAAITYEAKQYVPISISEVELDWQVIGGAEDLKTRKTDETDQPNPAAAAEKEEEKIQVLLAAVPKETVQRYEYIVKQIGLKLAAMEVETFSLVRSVVGPEKGVICLVDIGSRNTNITVVADGFVRINRSIDVGGGELTRVIAQSLGIQRERAEALKRRQGLLATGGEKEIVETMYPVLDKIMVELERVVNAFETREPRPIEKFFLVGGTSQLLGVSGYFEERLRLPICLGNPWARVAYPPELAPMLKELAPTFATALGLAMRPA